MRILGVLDWHYGHSAPTKYIEWVDFNCTNTIVNAYTFGVSYRLHYLQFDLIKYDFNHIKYLCTYWKL